MLKIERALISVSDKTGIVHFAAALSKLGIELISTGGTARALRDAGLNVRDISDLTGFPEIMDGRVKTLHPKVHGGLLFRRGILLHVDQAREHGIQPIDLVVVNLYPFEKTVARAGTTQEEAIEQIDIGGPSMIRSAAKNWESVTVIVDPDDYASVLNEIKEGGGQTRLKTRAALAGKVFTITSRYDAAISNYLKNDGEEREAPAFTLQGTLKQTLRYGENPHQTDAALYVLPEFTEPCVAKALQISGKEIGYNNLLDLNTAFEIVKEFDRPAVCIVKHNNPCGVAVADDLPGAFQLAYAGDPLSAFGGVLGVNRKLDLHIAEAILHLSGFKLDAIVAPTITADALKLLTTKKKWGASVIVIATGHQEQLECNPQPDSVNTAQKDIKSIPGGFLVQTSDKCLAGEEYKNLKCVTRREPSNEEMTALKFGWTICKHVKSNAIVLARGAATVGIGAGQMSRVDSVEIAIKKAGDRTQGAVLASDAFFPFPDGPEAAAKAGITAIIQPGGSVKDQEVIEVCDNYGLAMVTTGIRHFRH